MSRRNLRQKARVCYYEPEEPSLDEYLFCEQCADYVFEYCAIHGPLLVIPDDKVPLKSKYPSFVPRAALTIPHVFLHLARSIIPGAGLGVFTTLTLPRGVRFGPYRGLRTETVDSMYCWQIYDSNNKRSHVVDAADATRSNWMRYVNCSRHWSEQNLVAYQYKGQLYYRTIKIIPRFTELMVFYGSEFANILRVNLGSYNAPKGYAGKFGAPVPKKPKIVVQNNTENTTGGKLKKNERIEVILKDSIVTNKITVAKKPITASKILDTSDDVGINIKKCEENVVTSVCNNVREEKSNTTQRAIETVNSTLCSKNKPFSCDTCKKSFSSKSHLKDHIRIHTGEKPYECNVCKKCFIQKGNLKKHIRIHTGEKPYECNVCKKCFSLKINLKRHILIHTGEKPYECNVCKKCFSQKIHLKDHIRTHTGEKPYECNVCKKCFIHKHVLNDHIRTHTGEKPYESNACKKCIIQKNHLKKHIRTHTGEKPYECNVCKKCFIQKNILNYHIRTHTGEKPYQCNICEKSFSVKCNLIIHIQVHSR